MKILILHLSDIHFKEKGNKVLERIRNIKDAIQNIDFDLSACFVVVSGDVAFSGSKVEYKFAQDFFSELKTLLINNLNEINELYFLLVPGNHDCNFERDNQARQLLIKDILKNPDQLFDNSIITQCTSVQDEFFDFLKSFSDFNDIDKLYYQIVLNIKDYKIRFNCYNTAWMSKCSVSTYFTELFSENFTRI